MIGKEKLSSQLRLKIPEVVYFIAQAMNLTVDKAAELFYSSSTYKDLINEKTGLWAESNEHIANITLLEIRGVGL